MVSGDTALSYADLDARAGSAGRGAACDRGVGPDVLVAVALPRTADLVVALLAVLDGGRRLPADRPRLPGRASACCSPPPNPRWSSPTTARHRRRRLPHPRAPPRRLAPRRPRPHRPRHPRPPPTISPT
ncbi:hypothetical protein [Streptomyces sp. KL116D]|uniref:hypothetical protein n=1 Tax=Streptomyces sp. KL116D TaxID=3045152 RepID=UPI003556B89B